MRKDSRVVIDLRHCKEDTGTASQGTEKIRSNRQSTDASTTESGSGRDNTLQLLVHALLTVTSHHKPLILELLGNITRCRARDFNPGLGEEGTGDEHESDVHSRMNRVKKSLLEVEGRRHIVGNTGSSMELSRTLTRLPDTKKLNQQVIREARVQHLTDQEDVGGQGGLEHNRHVRGIEEADGVGSAHAALTSRLDRDLNAESLEVDDSGENDESRQEVHHVRKVLAIEGFLQGTLLVGPGQEEVEQSDDGALELRATASVDGRGRECLPDDRLANVGRNEKRDTTSKTITLLEQLIKKNDNKTGNHKLDDQQNTNTSTEVAGLAVETSKDINTGLAKGEDDGKQFLGGLVEFTVGLEVQVDIDQVGTSEELEAHRKLVRNCLPECMETYLEDHAGGDDGGNTQFHQRTPVTGQHHTQPIQGIRSIGGDNAIQRHLTHNQEDQQGQLRKIVSFESSRNPRRRTEHTPVHINFWLKGTFVSGAATSGRRGVKGLIKSRKRTKALS